MRQNEILIRIKYVWEYDTTSTKDYINTNKFSFCNILNQYIGRIIKVQRQEKNL